MTPEEVLKEQGRKLAAMVRASTAIIKVGLPAEEQATSKAYKSDGQSSAPTVLEVGIWHEYGTSLIPMRSFLRGPMETHWGVLKKSIGVQMNLVMENGLDIEVALNRIGMAATNVCKRAFTTRGYGVWLDIKQATKDAKGSDQVLIDTGLLRNSITWVVE